MDYDEPLPFAEPLMKPMSHAQLAGAFEALGRWEEDRAWRKQAEPLLREVLTRLPAIASALGASPTGARDGWLWEWYDVLERVGNEIGALLDGKET